VVTLLLDDGLESLYPEGTFCPTPGALTEEPREIGM
jgi:hypothetical protein